MANVTDFTVHKNSVEITGITKLKLPSNNFDDVDNTVAGDAAMVNKAHPLNKWEGGTFSSYDAGLLATTMKTVNEVAIVVTYDDSTTKTYTGDAYFKVSPAEVEASGSVNGLFDVEIVYRGDITIVDA